MLPNLRRTLAPLALAAAALFVLMPNIANAHNDDAYYADTANLPDQSKWMARAPDSTKVVQMSIPGTHDSGSRFGLGWSGPSLPLGLASHAVELLTVTQTLTISQQLNGGIRFLDIRLRHSNNELAVHHGPIYQNAMFGDVLKEVTSFLAANPSETVLMRVKQEHTEENTTRSFQQTFRSYFDSNKRWFAKPPAEGGNYDPTLGSVRGKILLLVDFPAHPIDSLGLHYHSTFNWQQDAYALHQPSDLHWKWEQVKGHLVSSERHGGRAINYLSGSMGGWMPIFPYFVASGHSSIGTGAPRLPTGLTTPGWEHNFPEFPRVDCFIGICTIAYEGTNTLTKDYINRVKPLYTGIVVADFPGAGLVKSVIDTNFRAQPLLNESNGLCLDIENGVNPLHRLVTFSCHGGNNQDIRFDGEQILVGGLCLDVEGGQNRDRAQVIAYPCHGGQNQKWRMNANGTIQSLLGGEARCMDLATENGGAILIQGCWPSSSDQRFWRPHRFPTQLLVNEANKKCADIHGGIGRNHRLTTWDCHGNDNQQFKFDGQQILVGGLCLDVRGNKNVHMAEIVSYTCNGQANQKWRLNANGTIQSLMGGETRCLDMATEKGGDLRLQTCWPSSPDQRFLRVPL